MKLFLLYGKEVRQSVRQPLTLVFVVITTFGLLLTAACQNSNRVETTTMAATTGVETGLSASDAVYRGNSQRTGEYAGVGPTLLGTLAWKYKENRNTKYPPVVANAEVYTWTFDGFLHVLSAGTGREIRQFAANAPPPVSFNGVLYYAVGSSLYSFSNDTQQLNWKFQANNVINSSPAVDYTTIYVGSDDGYAYAIDKATGKEKWKMKTEGPVISSVALGTTDIYFTSSRKVDKAADSVDYVGEIYALDKVSGSERWKFTPPGSVFDPVVYGNVVLFSNVGNVDVGPSYIYALDRDTGKELWKYTPSLEQYSPLVFAVSDSILYVGKDNGELYAINIQTKGELWRFSGPDFISLPSINSTGLYFGSGRNLYAVDAKTGKEKWHFTAEGLINTAPFLTGSGLYFADDAGYLYAIK